MSRSKHLIEYFYSSGTQKSDLKVGKQYTFRRSVVEILSLDNERVEIAKVVRGSPCGESIWVSRKVFQNDINRT